MSRQQYMRQVSKEEYEILTRFHPGEVRYYVDVGAPTRRTQGAKVTKKKRKSSRKPKETASEGVIRRTNSPVQLSILSQEFKEGTLSQNLYRLVKLKFENDPTKIIGRTDLVNSIVSSSIYHNNQVGPFVSDCLKRGILRYTGEATA